MGTLPSWQHQRLLTTCQFIYQVISPWERGELRRKTRGKEIGLEPWEQVQGWSLRTEGSWEMNQTDEGPEVCCRHSSMQLTTTTTAFVQPAHFGVSWKRTVENCFLQWCQWCIQQHQEHSTVTLAVILPAKLTTSVKSYGTGIDLWNNDKTPWQVLRSDASS